MIPEFTKILDRTVMSPDRDLSAETDYSDKGISSVNSRIHYRFVDNIMHI